MKSKIGEAVLCAVFKRYQQWVDIEKRCPGIGDNVPIYFKALRGPSSCLIEDYVNNHK